MCAGNTETAFRWQAAPLYGLLGGRRSFRFEPSQITPGSTTFVQSEDASGWLSFIMNPALPGRKKIAAQFEGFKNDLKARVILTSGVELGSSHCIHH